MQIAQRAASSRREMLVMMSLSTMYQYMYCMVVSDAFSLLPVFGGAMYMGGRIAAELARGCFGDNGKYLTRGMRVAAGGILGAMLLCVTILLAAYPASANAPSVAGMLVIVLIISLRGIWCRRLAGRRAVGDIARRSFIMMYALVCITALGLAALTFLRALPSPGAWLMFAGFALGVLMESYSLWRERGSLKDETGGCAVSAQEVRSIAAGLRDVGAYTAYRRMSTLILAALQVTLVTAYTFIGLTSEELFILMAIAVLCTVTMRELTDWILGRMRRRRPAELQALLIGLFLWMYGLVMFYSRLGDGGKLVVTYITLALCVSGLSIAVTSLASLDGRMSDVAEYSVNAGKVVYARMRAGETELAILFGQMLALLLLTLLCVFHGGSGARQGAALAGMERFRPLMVFPPLLLVIAATVSALRFPLNKRYFAKLERYLSGENESGALKSQLDSVVVKRHKNRVGINIIKALLRPLFRHKVAGSENLQGYEDGSMVLICNHGELYGPIVAILYIPLDMRPWTISSMMEKDAIVQYIYQNTTLRQKWCPDKLKMPLTRVCCAALLWMLRSIEAIPVYRGHPRELMKTFRMTVEAMQAGDNILIFPETGEAERPGEKGYASEGVGEFFTGFTMLGPAYYAKTKKRAVFIPVYASKHLRRLTFGVGIAYDPEAPQQDEKRRIVDGLQDAMQGMYETEKLELKRRKEEKE